MEQMADSEPIAIRSDNVGRPTVRLTSQNQLKEPNCKSNLTLLQLEYYDNQKS